MAVRIVTVFGGTGFLGSRVVRHLLGQDLAVRIASRHPDWVPSPSEEAARQSIRTDINDDNSVAAAVAGAYGVVNAVSLYVERGTETFHAVHVDGAERVARVAQQAGVERSSMFRGLEPILHPVRSGPPTLKRHTVEIKLSLKRRPLQEATGRFHASYDLHDDASRNAGSLE